MCIEILCEPTNEQIRNFEVKKTTTQFYNRTHKPIHAVFAITQPIIFTMNNTHTEI